MSIINYSRNQFQPEVLYLPLEHGGFIQLQEGAHEYANHAAYGLKNSRNPIVQNYIKSGSISIMLDVDSVTTLANNGTIREFAPLNESDYLGFTRKIQYAPISSNSNQVVTSDRIVDENNPIINDGGEDLETLLAPARKSAKSKVIKENEDSA